MAGEISVERVPLTPKMLWPVEEYKERDLYFMLEQTDEMLPNGRVRVKGYGEMIMLGGYSYLGLIGHPKIDAAAKAALTNLVQERMVYACWRVRSRCTMN